MIKIKSKKEINNIVDDSDRWHLFLEQINFSDNCWNWNGKKYPSGYGKFLIGALDVTAHRASFVFHKGAIPPKMVVMHSCDNKGCVSPYHLIAGTNADNSKDMVSKKRQAMGSRNGFSKLKENDVIEIRKLLLAGKTLQEIGNMYGVYKTCIYKIKSGASWSHLKHKGDIK